MTRQVHAWIEPGDDHAESCCSVDYWMDLIVGLAWMKLHETPRMIVDDKMSMCLD
jgi:hypothetical protein